VSDKQTILDLETKFWDTMKSQDVDTAASLVADESLITGPQGVSKIDKTSFRKMMEDGKWTLEDYKFSDIQTIFPDNDTAIIAYKVRQKGTMGGKPYDLECADASTWRRIDGDWQCVLHTETNIGNPFG
jgi:ketosteroid isomerase-like protein